MLTGSAGKEISQEEGDSRLSPSSTTLLELVLFGCLFCVFRVFSAKMRYALTTYCAVSVCFSLIGED
jgi:hypothetical protein